MIPRNIRHDLFHILQHRCYTAVKRLTFRFMHDRKSFCNRLINRLFCFGICLLAKRRHGKYFFERRAPFRGSQDKPVRFQFSQYSAEITAVHYIILANIAGDHTGIPHDSAKCVHFMEGISWKIKASAEHRRGPADLSQSLFDYFVVFQENHLRLFQIILLRID
jgi:hypothetical protein